VSSFLSEAICTHRMQSLLKFMEVDEKMKERYNLLE
jgi:hypothetical protein